MFTWIITLSTFCGNSLTILYFLATNDQQSWVLLIEVCYIAVTCCIAREFGSKYTVFFLNML